MTFRTTGKASHYYHYALLVIRDDDTNEAAQLFFSAPLILSRFLLFFSGLKRKKNPGLTQRERIKRDGKEIEVGSYDIQLVPRARKIHQSLLTTPFSSLRCLGACHSILRSPFSSPDIESSTAPQLQATFFPNLILTNGPGTGVIVILAALLLRYCDLGDLDRTSRIRTVYVESLARVKRLSLSGKLLLRVVDRFVVQWETLLDQTAGRGE